MLALMEPDEQWEPSHQPLLNSDANIGAKSTSTIHHPLLCEDSAAIKIQAHVRAHATRRYNANNAHAAYELYLQ